MRLHYISSGIFAGDDKQFDKLKFLTCFGKNGVTDCHRGFIHFLYEIQSFVSQCINFVAFQIYTARPIQVLYKTWNSTIEIIEEWMPMIKNTTSEVPCHSTPG